jgi:uncharacterized lipoprotein YddW (UPF0748 family)
MRRRGFLASAAALTAAVATPGVLLPTVASGAGPKPGCTVDPHLNKRQLRGLWVATVTNIDWPSAAGTPAAEQQAGLIDWLDFAVEQRHNAVFFQVRPTADSFWPGALEPWSRYLTGSQGVDPGYDPLGLAVSEAHKRNLELHGWFNPFRVSMNTDISQLIPTHPARVHPDWVITYGGKLYYNPGLPEVRAFCIAAIMDAVKKYDIDGVHFDDYFYPYPVAGETFDDADEFARYGHGLTLADWRRDNINKLILGLQAAIKKAKPWVKFGVSPFAVWRNIATDPLGSNTTAGAQTYDDLYADTRRWVREEWIDYIAPQVYWAGGFAPADYNVLVPWWADQVRGRDVHLYIGQATYKIGTSSQSPDWSDPREMSDHLAFNAGVPEVEGDIYFSAKDVRADRLGATTLLNDTGYSHAALVPTMPWLDRSAPQPVQDVTARRTGDAVQVRWRSGDRSVTGFAVYHIPMKGPGLDPCALADARYLVATQRVSGNGWQTYTDTSTSAGKPGYRYVVTSLDRLWNESKAEVSRP